MDYREELENGNIGNNFRIADLLHIILRRLWIVLLSVAIIFTSSVVYITITPRLYQSTAVLQIDSNNSSILNIGEALSQDSTNLEQMKTVEASLTRLSNLERVVLRPELFNNDKFVSQQLREKPGCVRILALALRGAINVRLNRGTRLIEVTAENKDPNVAALIANALVDEYLNELVQQKSGISRDAYAFLVSEEKRLKAKLELSEQALPDFKDINEIKQRIIVQEKEVSTLRQRYKDLHPKMIQALALLNDLRQEYITSLKNKITLDSSIAKNINETEEEKVNRLLSESEIRYNQLAREVETNRTIYDSVVKRLKETDVTMGVQQINMRKAEQAIPSPVPTKPRRSSILLVGVMGGLFLGVVLAFILDSFDTSIKTVDEAERYLGCSVLGAIPEIINTSSDTSDKGKDVLDEIKRDLINKSAALGAKDIISTNTRNDTNLTEYSELVMLKQEYSNVAEAFRTLRASFALIRSESEPRTFLFTSAIPSEGKSLTSANFAITMAQAGKRVLLIDSDLRRPTQSKQFKLSGNDTGLSNALASGERYSQFIISSPHPNLDLLLAGHRAPNPAELLAGGTFSRIIDEALQDYDTVVIDSAPLNAVSDTIYLINNVDIVCLVVRAGYTPRRSVARATNSLKNAGGKLAGVILNRLPTRSGFGYDPYYYYYSSNEKYGEAYGNNTRY